MPSEGRPVPSLLDNAAASAIALACSVAEDCCLAVSCATLFWDALNLDLNSDASAAASVLTSGRACWQSQAAASARTTTSRRSMPPETVKSKFPSTHTVAQATLILTRTCMYVQLSGAVDQVFTACLNVTISRKYQPEKVGFSLIHCLRESQRSSGITEAH